MASQVKELQSNKVVKAAEKDVRPIRAFFTKFGNDGVMIFSAALGYNLLMAIFPIAIAVMAILGIFIGSLDPKGLADITTKITNALPQAVSSSLVGIITKQKNQLGGDSIILAIIAVVLAVFNGSRLFVLIEYCFGIIYHVRQRVFIRQNLMAIGMFVLFIILIPIMVVASAIPAFVVTLLKSTPLGNLPGGGILAYLAGILGGVIAAYILFQAIYMVVPNQKISFRNSWLGALVAAIALELYLILFPLYAGHFLGFLASISAFIILLIFFYYFAVILLIGAEVNAFFSEKVKATPTDLVTMVHIATSHLPKAQDDKEQQAAQSHKEAPIGSTAAKTHVDETVDNPDIKAASAITTATAPGSPPRGQQAASAPDREERQVKEMRETKQERLKPKKTSSNKVESAIEAVAGTALAFVVETLRMRRRKLQ